MVSQQDGKYVLYPAYFDKKATRPLRRVPEEIAVPSPTAEQVAKACAKLRLKATLEKSKHHPARWDKGEGRVLIPVRGSKAVLVRQVGEALKELRQAAQAAN